MESRALESGSQAGPSKRPGRKHSGELDDSRQEITGERIGENDP